MNRVKHMNDKYQKLLNSNKFDRISFVLDYLSQIKDLQGNILLEDHAASLAKLYDDAFKDGQIDVNERIVAQSFIELDELYEK
jgi:disulfide oxidoreductase YuzD